METVPQRLKPHSKCSGYGTAEAVPSSKTEYFNKRLRTREMFLRFIVGDATVCDFHDQYGQPLVFDLAEDSEVANAIAP